MSVPASRVTQPRIAPSAECQNMGPSVKFASLVLIILIFVTVAIMVATLIYNQMKTVNNSANPTESTETAAEASEKKRKTVGYMTMSSTILGVITAIAAIWQFNSVSKAVKVCL